MPFSPETLTPEQAKELAAALGLQVLLICGVAPVFAMAFTRAVRKIISNRDGDKSVWSGETEHLEAAHIQHNRDHPRYNDASNGRMLTRREHYVDHYNRHGRNGLNTGQNKWSLNMIWSRLSDDEKQGLKPPDSL